MTERFQDPTDAMYLRVIEMTGGPTWVDGGAEFHINSLLERGLIERPRFAWLHGRHLALTDQGRAYLALGRRA